MNKNHVHYTQFSTITLYSYRVPKQPSQQKPNRGETSIESNNPLKVRQAVPSTPRGKDSSCLFCPFLSIWPFPLTVRESQLAILVFQWKRKAARETPGRCFKATQARALIKPRPKFKNIWSQKVRARRDLRGHPFILKKISLRLPSWHLKEVNHLAQRLQALQSHLRKCHFSLV